MKSRYGKVLIRSCLLLLGAGLLGTGLLLSEPGGLVEWRAMRAVVFESDDWGFAGFIPEPDAWGDLPRDELATGSFPEVYWHSTLEDSSCVATLCTMLGSFRGRDGLPPIMQANYIMSSLDWREDRGWLRHDLPEFPGSYLRPGLWAAVSRGMDLGVWRPEFHGTWHYDPQMRKSLALSSNLAREVTRRGIVLFPGSERAWELGPWRSSTELTAELDQSLEVFRALFDRLPVSVVAPDYTWNARVESIWESRGLAIIQGKREQRNSGFGTGLRGRIRKYLARRSDQLFNQTRHYLERNCRLETAQAPDPRLAVQECLVSVAEAWADGKPAIVETHRVNFSHTDPEVMRLGMEGLESFLKQILSAEEGLPVFLVDAEVAQLASFGTSACIRGERLVVRNGTHSRKVVAVPSQGSGLRAKTGGFLALEPGQELVLKFAN